MAGMSESPGRDLFVMLAPATIAQAVEYYVIPHEVGYGNPFSLLCMFGFLISAIMVMIIEGPALLQRFRLYLLELENEKPYDR